MNPNIRRWIFLNLLLANFIILTSCENETQITNYEPNYLLSLDATSLPKGNRPMTMFEDAESPS
ncbi:MAG TPA: hypothetical protein VJU52_00180, partial [Flavobacterium sp.]|nr:hypothetical protein [Flavobacterium sp.]